LTENGRFVETSAFDRDVAIIGGCGRVGLPLGVALASRGLSVTLVDVDTRAVEIVGRGEAPFLESDIELPLREAISAGRLAATTDPRAIRAASVVIIVVGTATNNHRKSDKEAMVNVIDSYASHMHDRQLIVLRSTLSPGTTRVVERALTRHRIAAEVAYCPERIAEGKAMTELFSLPQIVAARSQAARTRAECLFGNLTALTVTLDPEEAELAKLFTNAWRYLKFAISNEFWTISTNAGVDYNRVRQAMVRDYPRASDIPPAGFAAGPCLLKDTSSLAAYSDDCFSLGRAALLINEGLPFYAVSRLERKYPLVDMSVGILGMAFKAGSDDTRASLSYKLRDALIARDVVTFCTDPYAVDPDLVPLAEVLRRVDLIVIGAPHPEYRDLDADVPIVDIWGITGRGVAL
jgi:UDP-N-acetyl-D-mannosaminuronic acid dehydrogenase